MVTCESNTFLWCDGIPRSDNMKFQNESHMVLELFYLRQFFSSQMSTLFYMYRESRSVFFLKQK